MDISNKQKQTQRYIEQICGFQEGGWWRRDGLEFEISRCKLLYIEWINNKVLLYSTGSYIQYPMINHNGKEYDYTETKVTRKNLIWKKNASSSTLHNLGRGVWASQVAQQWRTCLPMQEMQEMWVQSLNREDPLHLKITIHSSILAWKISLTEEPGRLQSRASQRIRHNWATEYSCIIKYSAQTFLVCNVAEFVGISETFTLGRIKSF